MELFLTLGAALLGTAVATTGLLLFFSRYTHGRSRGSARLLRHGLLGSALFAAGIALILVAWQRWPLSATAVTGESVSATASSPAPASTLWRDRKLVIVVWGTPSDNDQATPAEEAEFGARLAAFAQDILVTRTPSLSVTTAQLSRAEADQLLRRATERLSWCAGRSDTLILAIGVGARHLDASDSFAPWREPVLELYDCSTSHSLWETVQVEERRGDHFPYQQALGERLNALLARFDDESRGG